MKPGTALRHLRWPTGAMLVALLMSGCGTSPTIDSEQDGPGEHRDVSQVPDAVPKAEPRSRYGNPASYVVFGRRYHTMQDGKGFVQRGIASWYGKKFHGRRTSSGEIYDMYRMTAAHKKLPLPSYVEVVNLENKRRVVVKVNDRGPFHDNRIIDLSYAAASRIGMLGKGTALVEIRVIDPEAPKSAQTAPVRPVSPPAPRAAPQKVSAPAPQTPVAATPAPATTGPRIYLQAGAFSSSHNAELLRKRLQNGLAQTVRVLATNADNGQMHRVQVGPLPSIDSVDEISNRMHGLGIAEPLVVIE